MQIFELIYHKRGGPDHKCKFSAEDLDDAIGQLHALFGDCVISWIEIY